MGTAFKLKSRFRPAGDQARAVESLALGLRSDRRNQVLLGVTGSGKTFTVANVIAACGKPALVISPNKVLAAQLYAEFKSFFPGNAVEYFISYYDYYQPEAYIPSTDTYIEKDAAINEHIERLRLKATTSLLTRRDVVIVASVSCIYNIGDPADVRQLCLRVASGKPMDRRELTQRLTAIQYERNDTELAPGRFRARGPAIEVFPSYLEHPLRLTLEADGIRLERIHSVSREVLGELEFADIYPSRQFVMPSSKVEPALDSIAKELDEQLRELRRQNKLLEAQRLERRTRYDLAMLRSMGFCHGIENYSRHLSGRGAGERPFCLLDYFERDFLLVVDESHVTVPQFRGMYEGDRSRKQTLIEHGFRLPSALDNRPLRFDEFESLRGQAMFISATPGPYEISLAGEAIAEQIVRPTGLVDPKVQVHPTKGQIEHLLAAIKTCVGGGFRALVTTLTKRTSEDLAAFLASSKVRVRYLHSDIESLERIKILQDLRLGKFDVLVGVNLLREGLDLPEVALVAVLDADKEGFLRSETTLIQICGRAARNLEGHVILYADRTTGSMARALKEMERRRAVQKAYNAKNRITPRSISKEVERLEEFEASAKTAGLGLVREMGRPYAGEKPAPQIIAQVERDMKEAADRLDFEVAASLRDQLFELRAMLAHKKPKILKKRYG